jgi:hypothetical protein
MNAPDSRDVLWLDKCAGIRSTVERGSSVHQTVEIDYRQSRKRQEVGASERSEAAKSDSGDML